MEESDLRRNTLLARLPSEELSEILERAEEVHMQVRDCVQEPDQPIAAVYFALGSVFSMVATDDRNDSTVEVATIGREGMVGLPLFLGAATSPLAVFCQVPGPAARLSASDLRRVLTDDGNLHRRLNRFIQATMVQISQNVLCNASHNTEQRAARWLLTTQDRVEEPEFPLTQEFLAQMLGVRRPTVSEIASGLQDDGLISYRRGIMTITDRPRLQDLACHCYQVVRAEFDSLASD